MIRAFLGALTTGRLARLPFIGFWVLLWVLFALYGLGIALGIGLAEPLIFDDLATAQGYLLEHFAPPVLAALGLFCLLFVFAQFNLLAKRIRDMGLPGWSVLLLIALTSGVLGAVLPPGGELMRLENQVNGSFNGVLVLALLLIPSGLFARRGPPAPVGDPATGSGQVDHTPTGSEAAAVPPADAAEVPVPEGESVAVPPGDRGRVDEAATASPLVVVEATVIPAAVSRPVE